MSSDNKETKTDNPLDQADGIIPPIIINQNNGYVSLENDSVRFKNSKQEFEEPELVLSTDTLPSAPPAYSDVNLSTPENNDDIPRTPSSAPKTIPQRIIAFITLVIQNITLEPGEFMFSLGGGIGYTCYSQLTLDKACYKRGYNQTICDNVTSYDDIYEEISHDVSFWSQKDYLNIFQDTKERLDLILLRS